MYVLTKLFMCEVVLLEEIRYLLDFYTYLSIYYFLKFNRLYNVYMSMNVTTL